MSVFVVVFHVLACLTLILVVLLQAGSESGLSGAIGGGASESVLGAKSNVFLTRFTTVMAILFMVSSLVLAIVPARQSKSVVLKKATKQPVPQAKTEEEKKIETLLNQLKEDAQKLDEQVKTTANDVAAAGHDMADVPVIDKGAEKAVSEVSDAMKKTEVSERPTPET